MIDGARPARAARVPRLNSRLAERRWQPSALTRRLRGCTHVHGPRRRDAVMIARGPPAMAARFTSSKAHSKEMVIMGAESAKPSQSERSGRQRARRHVQQFAVVAALFAVSALASQTAMASSPRTFHTTFQESEQFLDEGA